MNNRICKNCDFENLEEASYCGACGNELGNACKNCGSLNFNTNVCTKCGRVISSALKEEEFEWQAVIPENNPTMEHTKVVTEPRYSLPRPGEISNLISTSFDAYKSNASSFLALALISSIPATIFLAVGDDLFNYFSGLMEDTTEKSPTIDRPNWALIFPLLTLAILGEIVSTASIIFGSAQHMNKEKVGVSKCVSYSFSSIFRLISVVIIFALVLIIPGILSIFFIGIPLLIFLIVKFWFVSCFVIIENSGITEAFRGSWNLVKSKWWVTFGTGLIIIIITALASALMSFVTGQAGSLLDNEIITHVLRGIATTVIAPFQAISTGIYFLGLRESKRKNQQ